jgi:hypothetical protein
MMGAGVLDFFGIRASPNKLIILFRPVAVLRQRCKALRREAAAAVPNTGVFPADHTAIPGRAKSRGRPDSD